MLKASTFAAISRRRHRLRQLKALTGSDQRLQGTLHSLDLPRAAANSGTSTPCKETSASAASIW
jgi:hypothetical protein